MCTSSYDFSGQTYDPSNQTYGPTFNIAFNADPCVSYDATNFVFTVNGQVMGGSQGYFEFFPPSDPSDHNWDGYLSMGNDGAQWRGEVWGSGNQIFSVDSTGSLILYHQEFFPTIAQMSGGPTGLQTQDISVPSPSDFIAILLWCVVACGALAFSTRDNV